MTQNIFIDNEVDNVVDNDCLSNVAIKMYEKFYVSSLTSLMAGIHHEIKSPLQSIGGALEVLNFFIDTIKNNKIQVNNIEYIINDHDISIIKECSNIINHSQSRIAEVLETLSLSNKEFNKNDLSEINIRNFVDDVINNLIYLNEFKNNTINICTCYSDNIPKKIWTIPSFLKNILLNLLCNACNAIISSQRITGIINIYINIQDDKIYFDVQDNGCGISLEDYEKIFEPFFTRRLTKNSTGLGLFICRSMARKMGGDIRIKHSEPELTIMNFDIKYEQIEKI